jgi:hypothetical protein
MTLVLRWGIWVGWGSTKRASSCKKRLKTFENSIETFENCIETFENSTETFENIRQFFTPPAHLIEIFLATKRHKKHREKLTTDEHGLTRIFY